MTPDQTLPSTSIFPGEVFAETAAFDSGMSQLLPYYAQMLDAVAACVPTTANRILELGCGTGALSLRVLERCPSAQLVAVDYSPRMVAFAQDKLHRAGLGDRVIWIEADFGAWADASKAAFSDIEPLAMSQRFDACLSSLAIHHLDDAIKQKLFQRVQHQLQPGGCFWNADPVLPESPALESIYQAARNAWAQQQGIDLTAVRSQIGTSVEQGYSGPDRLATLDWHLTALTHAGFTTTAVPWKYYGLAVFGGII
jgi:tRNA (cmo5U34)-methyltransferase